MDDFATVCQMYYQKVYRFLLSLSGDPRRAEDLTQEVFYRALLHIGQYRDDGHMFTWLCTIGKNCWISECRKEKRQVPLEQWNAVDEKGPEGAAAEPGTCPRRCGGPFWTCPRIPGTWSSCMCMAGCPCGRSPPERENRRAGAR